MTRAVHRWLVLGLVIATTALATFKLWAIFEVHGFSAEEWLLLFLFAVLFSWIAASFGVACVGACELWSKGGGPALAPPAAPSSTVRTRTVLAVPIYNEDCAQVFAAIDTMQASLREA